MPRSFPLAFIQCRTAQNLVTVQFTTVYSTVVIWSGHLGSREDHALLLGKDLRTDLVHPGTLG
jgi:hypothetical protein